MKLNLTPQRLYSQIVLLVVAILTATFFSFGWITLQKARDQQVQAIQNNTKVMALSLGEGCAQYLLVEDFAGLDVFLAKSIALPDITTLQVYEASGALVSEAFKNQSPPHLKDSPPAHPQVSVQIHGNDLHAWQPLVAGSHLGWIRISVSLEGLNTQLKNIWQSTLRLTLCWIAISVLLLLFFLQRPVEIIKKLSVFTSELNTKKGELLDTSHGPLELRQLGEAINKASLELQNSEQ